MAAGAQHNMAASSVARRVRPDFTDDALDDIDQWAEQ
jgi:hypothetical protein